VVVNLLGLNAWAWRERSALGQKREAIRQTLTQTFPQVKVVVDPPVQMEKEVAALRQTTGSVSGRDLEAMLAALVASLPSQRTVSGLEYNAGELRVKGLGVAAVEGDMVGGALKARGYTSVPQGDTLLITREATP